MLLGTNGGGFAPRVDYEAGNQTDYVAIAEIDGDGRPDLVVTNRLDNSVTVHRGNGDGHVPAATIASPSGSCRARSRSATSTGTAGWIS